MRIAIRQDHFPFPGFSSDDLGDFCLLTGKNGVGKSWLLRSLADPNVEHVDIWLPGGIQANATYVDYQKLLDLWQAREPHPDRREPIQPVFALIKQSLLSLDEVLTIYPNESRRSEIRSRAIQARTIEDLKNEFGEPGLNVGGLFSKFQTACAAPLIQRACKDSGLAPMQLSEADLDAAGIWQTSGLFSNEVVASLRRYHEIRRVNMWKHFQSTQGVESSFIPTEEFDMRYYTGQLDHLNFAILEAGLHFRFVVNAEDANGHVELQDLKTAKIIRPEWLSTGQRILLSLACCAFNASFSHISQKPQVLLLDEIDAFLHPEMTQIYLRIIRRYIVDGLKIKVIATTHSPSTVAIFGQLSEEIYMMSREQPGLAKCSPTSALTALTFGVPNLSVSIENRRQVFCENPSDAEIYEALYINMKRNLPSETTLEFLAPGIRSVAAGDINNGKSVVEAIVNDLRDKGVLTVVGLVDWDNGGARPPSIYALEGRKGIETWLMDPIFVLAWLGYHRIASLVEMGITDQITFSTLQKADPRQMQKWIDLLLDHIWPELAGTERIAVKYANDLVVMLPTNLLREDHFWAQRVMPKIKYGGNGADGTQRSVSDRFMLTIAQQVMPQLESLYPLELRDIFVRLLNASTSRH